MYLIIIPALAIARADVFVITLAPGGVEGREVKRSRHQPAEDY
jgi:hypothetical protein